MRRIAIINQKGGVGKTTTAVNLAAALAECGQRVCVLDLDPQAHATTHFGVQPDGESPSMYDVLVNSRPIAEVRLETELRRLRNRPDVVSDAIAYARRCLFGMDVDPEMQRAAKMNMLINDDGHANRRREPLRLAHALATTTS